MVLRTSGHIILSIHHLPVCPVEEVSENPFGDGAFTDLKWGAGIVVNVVYTHLIRDTETSLQREQ